VSRMLITRNTRNLLFLSSLLLVASCAANQKSGVETNANDNTLSATPPFEIREPDRYRATRIITTTNAAGETAVMKNSIARDGELRRDETETTGQRVVYLTLPEGRFILLPDEKLLAQVDETQPPDNDDTFETSPDGLLHSETITPRFQKLGNETIGGKNLQKYRVVVNNPAGENVSVGETLLWFDEQLRMPVKTESRSPDGTRTTTELSNVVLEVDKTLFQLPKDYQKIEFQKLRERLNAANHNQESGHRSAAPNQLPDSP